MDQHSTAGALNLFVQMIPSFLIYLVFFFQCRSKILKIEQIFSQSLHFGGLIGENFVNDYTCINLRNNYK